MPHPIVDKLADLRCRVRMLVIVRGLCAILSSALGAAIILGLTDYVLQIQDRGLRMMISLALLGALGWACYRFFYLPAAVHFRDADLAVKLQRRFPALEDRLLSAVEFIAQDEDDPTAGSPGLRRSVIARTTAETADIDFNRAVSPRPVVHAVLLSIFMCSTAAMLAMLDPAASQTALARLVNPLGSAAWPQKNHLAIRNPVERVGRGRAFEIEAVDSDAAPLPAEVFIHYRFTGADGALTYETVLMRQIGKTAVARRENVARPFSYRVEGGDDRSMPWLPVEVVEPPAIESLSIRLIPPPYTGWPVEKADGDIRALAGTRLEIDAKASKRLQTAALCLEDGREFPGRLGPDGLRIAISDAALVVEKSGSYWFRLTDREGLTGGQDDRWEIVALADSPPSVTIEQPVANLYVTPQAVVALRVTAKDDLAIRDINLAFYSMSATAGSGATADMGAMTNLRFVPGLPSSASQETIIPIYTGPQHVSSQASGRLSQLASSGQRQVVDYLWQLESLRLAPGMQVVFQAVASDYMPQTARSEPRRLIVVTPREIEDRIAGRQNLLLSELERVLKMQRANRAQVEAVQIRLDETKRLEKSDLDQLRADELGQRQVDLVLTGAGEGIPSHISAILADLENNRIDNPDLKQRLNLVLDEIDRLQRDHLPVIGRELTSAVKSAEIALGEASANAGPEVAAALASAGKNQDQVVATLEKLLAQFAQNNSSLRFERELNQLLREQEDTARQTAETGRRTLTKELKDLPPQDAADLKIIASRQFEHARSLDRILQDMDRSGAEMQTSDPLAARIVAIALDQAGRMGIGGQMRSCADNLRQNQIGQAAELQATIIDDLRQIIDILIHQSTRQSTADELARLENAIKFLRQRQEKIGNETRQMEQNRQSQGQLARVQLAAILDLARTQRSLQIDTMRLGDQIAEASAAFALALDIASRDMEQAAGYLDRHLTAAETQQAQQNAIRRFDLLLDALKPEPPENQPPPPANAENKPPANANQATKQGQSTVNLSELKMLKILQEEINRRTAALAESIGPDQKPNDQQRKEYEQLAEEQARLAELILKMMKEK
jgi:Domain of unknown function (DUF4175)